MSHFIKLTDTNGHPVFVNLETVSRVTLNDGTAYVAYATGDEHDFDKITDPDSYARLMEELEDAADREPSLQHYLEDIAMALNAVVACVDDTGVVVRHG